jgi:hypothetical protein
MTFYRGSGGVKINVFPYGFSRDEFDAVVDGFHGLVREELCGVFVGGLEVVLIYEVSNFRVC